MQKTDKWETNNLFPSYILPLRLVFLFLWGFVHFVLSQPVLFDTDENKGNSTHIPNTLLESWPHHCMDLLKHLGLGFFSKINNHSDSWWIPFYTHMHFPTFKNLAIHKTGYKTCLAIFYEKIYYQYLTVDESRNGLFLWEFLTMVATAGPEKQWRKTQHPSILLLQNILLCYSTYHLLAKPHYLKARIFLCHPQ